MLTDKQRAQTADRQKRYRRREQIDKGLPPMPSISSMPGTARWTATLAAAEALVNETFDEMENYYEERSMNWRESWQADQHKERQREIKAILKKFDQVLL